VVLNKSHATRKSAAALSHILWAVPCFAVLVKEERHVRPMLCYWNALSNASWVWWALKEVGVMHVYSEKRQGMCIVPVLPSRSERFELEFARFASFTSGLSSVCLGFEPNSSRA
jgi:hypothetical protein